MSAATIFIDRDGTLIEEPLDQQVDALHKVRFMPGVFAALTQLTQLGYRLVVVSNQDGLGAETFPHASFSEAQQFILQAFASQGIRFDAVFICPHRPDDHCDCRKPKTGLVRQYLAERAVDLSRSAVVGDRGTDLEFAKNLGIRGFLIRRDGAPGETWPQVAEAITARRAHVTRETKETQIRVSVNLDTPAPLNIDTGIGFFDHMIEQLASRGGFSLNLSCLGDLHIDEHHTVEDCALTLGQALREALGSKAGIGRFGYVLPMDESLAQVSLDLSGRPSLQFTGTFARDAVGGLPTELVPHFFRSLTDALGATLHLAVSGENTHHMVEACFKCVGAALRQALRREGSAVPSTKGLL
jgi:imidazoleglycerol-phosphate dehydratase / histidinol-phosphatase